MQKIVLTYCPEYNLYTGKNSVGPTIGYLENFLHDLYPRNINFLIEWTLESNSNKPLQGNSNYLYKKNDSIYIGIIFSSKLEEDESFFKIKANEFINLLKTWKDLVEAKTKKIIVTQNDDGCISISGE